MKKSGLVVVLVCGFGALFLLCGGFALISAIRSPYRDKPKDDLDPHVRQLADMALDKTRPLGERWDRA